MKRKVTFYRPHVHCNNKQPFPRISATWLEAYCYPLKRYLCADKLLWSSIQTPHNFQLKTSAPTCCSITSIWNSISHQFRPKGKLSSFVRKQQTSTWNHTSYFLPQPNRSVRSGTLPEQSVVNQSESFYRSQFPLESWSPEPAGSKRGKTLSLSLSLIESNFVVCGLVALFCVAVSRIVRRNPERELAVLAELFLSRD